MDLVVVGTKRNLRILTKSNSLRIMKYFSQKFFFPMKMELRRKEKWFPI
jgi:hypothetical protein